MARNREAGRAVCQAWRQHPWEPIETVLEPRGRSWVFVVELECSRCDTTKTVEAVSYTHLTLPTILRV